MVKAATPDDGVRVTDASPVPSVSPVASSTTEPAPLVFVSTILVE